MCPTLKIRTKQCSCNKFRYSNIHERNNGVPFHPKVPYFPLSNSILFYLAAKLRYSILQLDAPFYDLSNVPFYPGLPNNCQVHIICYWVYKTRLLTTYKNPLIKLLVELSAKDHPAVTKYIISLHIQIKPVCAALTFIAEA